MPVFIVTGKTGQGKGLCSVALMREYLDSGKPIATNMDIKVENFRDKYNAKTRIIRLPDYPSYQDMHALGYGNLEPWDEDENGLILLDEGATWLNSRNWNAPGRKEFNDWLVQRRKWGWDIIIQIQSIDSLDKQARDAVADYEVRATYTRAIRIPIVTWLLKKITGKRIIKFPKWARWHTARMRNLEGDYLEDVHRYNGRDVYQLYNTVQKLDPNYPHGMYSYLTPWHLVGRYLPPKKSITWWLKLTLKLPFWISIIIASWLSPECRSYFMAPVGAIQGAAPSRARN